MGTKTDADTVYRKWAERLGMATDPRECRTYYVHDITCDMVWRLFKSRNIDNYYGDDDGMCFVPNTPAKNGDVDFWVRTVVDDDGEPRSYFSDADGRVMNTREFWDIWVGNAIMGAADHVAWFALGCHTIGIRGGAS